mmetsp:Transcript_83802/g.237676  ORF Transcript_83802/g.237676 Transcript_83802/m.237676 type:complete len:203 (-) Transcript_83802:404-1012(-)
MVLRHRSATCCRRWKLQSPKLTCLSMPVPAVAEVVPPPSPARHPVILLQIPAKAGGHHHHNQRSRRPRDQHHRSHRRGRALTPWMTLPVVIAKRVTGVTTRNVPTIVRISMTAHLSGMIPLTATAEQGDPVPMKHTEGPMLLVWTGSAAPPRRQGFPALLLKIQITRSDHLQTSLQQSRGQPNTFRWQYPSWSRGLASYQPM